ncbi:SigE family RNA polymerase sigma factor [Acidothermaceae bacterium B102]|nr:SigE family RNA polymerase sigma factor [Acidothermaceae bacterium B102]
MERRASNMSVDHGDSSAGDPSFDDFVSARSASLLRSAYVLTGGQHSAEDLVQTTLLRCLPRWGQISDHERYVRRTLLTTYLGWRRRRQWSAESPTGSIAEPPDAHDAYAQIDQRNDLLSALKQLAPRQRAIVAMRYLEDWDDAEIAATLGIAQSTVRSQAMRALETLRHFGALDEPTAGTDSSHWKRDLP